jgi:hypothetical protein
MNIYSKAGSKVIFAHPGNGYKHDQEQAAEYLKVGEVYTVSRTEVGGFHTEVYLEEVPGRGFNSVMFDDSEGTAEGRQ